MQHYLTQLLTDVAHATDNLPRPYMPEGGLDLHDWLSPEEEENTAPTKQLEEYTGIQQAALPPAEMLTDEQVKQLLEALNKLLNECNWHFVMQIEVPERIQYETIRQNFNQEIKLKQWHIGFFEFCQPGQEHKTCTLGEYCHCAFFKEFFKSMVHEDLSPEEERRRMLEIEIKHIKRKYEDDWMKYYPYHLDEKYDDDGNPYDYGSSDWFDDDDEDEDDNWWRR
jgi:hypothetical protein